MNPYKQLPCAKCLCDHVPGFYNVSYEAVMYICQCGFHWTRNREEVLKDDSNYFKGWPAD